MREMTPWGTEADDTSRQIDRLTTNRQMGTSEQTAQRTDRSIYRYRKKCPKNKLSDKLKGRQIKKSYRFRHVFICFFREGPKSQRFFSTCVNAKIALTEIIDRRE